MTADILFVSFGVTFLGSIFSAADSTFQEGTTTSRNDDAFIIRDKEHGLNMDLMTYSMYSLTNKEPRALLDYAVLVDTADRTFQTFFQHFVRSGMSLTTGGSAYQKLDDNSLESLEPPVTVNGSVLPQQRFTSLNTPRQVEADVSNRIQVLHMSSIATYLTAAILIWLIGTAVLVMALQRKYTSSIIHDVHLIADVMVLVAGSDNLMRLLQQKGVGLKQNRDIKTMLGWFKGKDGEVRWGIEVVGGRDAVDWVDSPKQAHGVRVKKSFLGRLLP